MMRKAGFTLIEMIAVIVVMGLLAMAAVLALAHTAEKHRADVLRTEMEQTDALVRSAARQSGHAQKLVYDLVHNQIVWQQGNEDASTMKMLQLPDDDSLTVRTLDQDAAQGRIEIEISPSGYSPSYAVKFDRAGETSHWMIVVGMSGRVFWTDDEKQVETLFKALDTQSLQPAAEPLALSGPDPH